MSVLGNWVVILALISSGAAMITYTVAAFSQQVSGTSSRRVSIRIPRLLLNLSTLLVIFASVLFMTLIIRHDYSVGYVFSYSDNALPLHFLISSFYAGQEGSFLFWALCSAVLALVLRSFTARRRTEAWVMAAFMGVQTILLLLVASRSPFRLLWDVFPQAPSGMIPPDGRGLNPLLQNFWMVIHPPVLFVGFAAMAAPFSLAVGGLWKKQYSILTEQGLPWVLFATSVLGLGIMLGGYWAYGVLGWGGYWGWDPVENSSLVPWLIGIGLLHTLLAQLRTGKFVRTNFLLAIVSFLLVVYSTFLTRSGILGDASVHSFTNPGAVVYWLLLFFLVLIGVTGAAFLIMRRKDMKPVRVDTLFLTREISLGAGTIALLLSALVVLFGTSLPIVSTTRVEPSFYDATNLPIAIAMVLLIGFSLAMQWEMQDARETLRRSVKSLAAALLVVVVLLVLGIHNPTVLVFIFSSVFAFVVNLDIAIRVARGDWRFIGGKIAHMGVAIFFVGVIVSGKFSASDQAALPLNVPVQSLGHRLTYVGHRLTEERETAFTVVVERAGSTFELAPVMFEVEGQGIMRNPDIASFAGRDFYLSPVSFDQRPSESSGWQQVTLQKGQSISVGGVQVTFTGFDMSSHGMTGDGGMRVGAILEIMKGTERETVVPVAFNQPAPSKLFGVPIRLASMNVGGGSTPSTIAVEIQGVSESSQPSEVLVVEASVKPLINLVWGGTVVMMIGFLLSILKRSKES